MLRKKIISLGLSAATAGTFAFTVAAPTASADHNVQHNVCQALPAATVTQNGAIASAQLNRDQADTAQSDLDAATAAYVDAINDLLDATVNGGDVVNATAQLNVSTSNIGVKFTAWSNKTADLFIAQYALDVAQWQLGIINGLNAPCLVP